MLKIKRLIFTTALLMPVFGYCAGTPVMDVNADVNAVKTQQLLTEQLKELKLINHELQQLNARQEANNVSCHDVSKSYTNDKKTEEKH
ncbi:hypothetical protein ACV75_16695 [Salmonella enterica]|nr:hypothetical protein [Salmonella enterica]ECL1354299.1 hypothetical protein [Salmonella enterica]